ncbi:MAG: hypothetical protein H7840_07360 [Alphaproteobacteria bacterium]
MSGMDANPFLTAVWGRFLGVRTWEQLDALWDVVRADAECGWYLYALDQPPPASPSVADAVRAFVAHIDACLHHEHRAAYCGFVYVDDPARPSFIKAFEPRRFSGCGHGTGKALPSWILCKLPPVDLPASIAPAKPPTPWWKGPFGKG